MDRILYTASNGAARVLEQQAVIANNLANVTTTGFRKQLAIYRSVPVQGHAGELPTRVSTVASTPGSNFRQGALAETGRPLDAAIAGEGWFTVQTSNGEAYTRAGEFAVNERNELVTITGLPVLSIENRPIKVPGRGNVTFSPDGRVTVMGIGGNPRSVQVLGQLKLVNPPIGQLERGGKGLFRVVGGKPVQADPTVRIIPGFIEKSNASPVEAMVAMISNARQFQMQMKVIESANANERRANSILSVNG